MRHRVYHLTHGVSLLGLRPQDFVVILFSVLIGLNVLGALFPGRWRLVFAGVFIFLTFKGWQVLRDRLPNKFFLHLFRWLSEPEVFKVRPDFRAIPLVVNPVSVQKKRKSSAPSKVETLSQGNEVGVAPLV